MAEQQVQITDLDPQQLQEVKKQLDEVRCEWHSRCAHDTHPSCRSSTT